MSENAVKAPKFRVGDTVRRKVRPTFKPWGANRFDGTDGQLWTVVSILSTRPNRYYYELTNHSGDTFRCSLQAEEDLF